MGGLKGNDALLNDLSTFLDDYDEETIDFDDTFGPFQPQGVPRPPPTVGAPNFPFPEERPPRPAPLRKTVISNNLQNLQHNLNVPTFGSLVGPQELAAHSPKLPPDIGNGEFFDAERNVFVSYEASKIDLIRVRHKI